MKAISKGVPLPLAVVLAFVLLAIGYLVSEDVGGGGAAEAQPAAAQTGVPADEPVARVAAGLGPSVVQINVSGTAGEGVGSGVIYRSDGYVVTNNHVVEGASSVEVAFADGSTEPGEVVGTDPSTDLAVVRVDRRGLPAASFGGGADLAVGQLAVAIGSPQGFQSTVTSGVVSGVGREFPAELTGGADSSLVDLVQTDAPISPGNSGGALADRDGRVVGINVAYLPPGETGAESIGFAIPSETVTSVADDLIQDGEVSTAYLGVFTADLASETADAAGSGAEAGALVTEVEPGGPAEAAGVEADDVITAVGGVGVEGSGDLLGALRDYEPGDAANLTVSRGGEELRLEARLGEREG